MPVTQGGGSSGRSRPSHRRDVHIANEREAGHDRPECDVGGPSVLRPAQSDGERKEIQGHVAGQDPVHPGNGSDEGRLRPALVQVWADEGNGCIGLLRRV